MESPPATRPTHGRERSKSSFSFRSDKSDKSESYKTKVNVKDLKESDKEKRRSKFSMGSARDPNRAINENEPGVRAQNEAATLPYIRAVQHRDWKGELISDPDASNPARSRFERPLDTIKSFEAAIDSGYRRRNPNPRSESADLPTQFSSRRSSYVGGPESSHGNRHAPPQGPHGGPGGYNRGNPWRQHHDHPPRPAPQRYGTAPAAMQPDYGVFAQHAYRESHDTVNTGDSYGTSGSEPWTNSTYPSSENSSVDRVNVPPKMGQEYGDAYAGQPGLPYSRGSPQHDTIQEEHGYDGTGYTQGYYEPGPASPSSRQGQFDQAYTRSLPLPPLPSHQGQPPHQAQSSQMPYTQQQHQPARNVMPSGNAQPQSRPQPQASQRPQPGPRTLSKNQQRPPLSHQTSSGKTEKRKSWLRRTFSGRD